MRTIQFSNEHRRKHFEFFRNMNHPHFGLCGPADITETLAAVKRERLPFMVTIAWLVSAAANAFPELRQRIRAEQVVEHELVHPSFSIPTEASEVFSFCHVSYSPSYRRFLAAAESEIQAMQARPSFEDEPGRDDYLFLSSIPWVSFTAVQHAMQYHPHDSVPRVTWGRFFEEHGRVKMPLSLQAHHALVDGRHAGLFFQEFETLCEEPGGWMG